MVTLARSHPAAVDAFLAGAVLAAGLYALSLGGRGSTAVLAALEIALALPLIWRRRYPLPMFAITGAVALAQWLYAERTLAGYALLISLYSVARRNSQTSLSSRRPPTATKRSTSPDGCAPTWSSWTCGCQGRTGSRPPG
jgi:hypothetical protein